MRPDMAKVIVERPRIGSSAHGKPKGYRRRLQQYRPDELPAREGMKRRHQGYTKMFNEHLGPLRRYLDSRVGRPWNKVFSEICAHIDRSSAVQDHVRDHVAQYVATHVVEIDGEPCNGEGSYFYGRPLWQVRWVHWYVCPRSGILKRIKPGARSRNRPSKPQDTPKFVSVSDSLQCRLIDGAWYVVTLAALPEGAKGRAEWDVVFDRPASEIDPLMARQNYGALVFACGKRRLARRELAQFPIPIALWR
jgi:hypothetical protein